MLPIREMNLTLDVFGTNAMLGALGLIIIREFCAENSLQNTNLQIIIFQLSISCLKVKTPIFYCILKKVISDPNARCWVPDASIGEDGREEASKAVCELNSLTSASE